MNDLPGLLLIDDDPSFLRATALGLQDSFRVRCLEDPREVHQYLATVDVIVSDYKMHFMSGQDIISLAQNRPNPIPVVLVSAYTTKELAIQAANQRAFILEKPVSLRDLQEVLARATGGKKRGSEIRVNIDTLKAMVGNTEIHLTDTEMKILQVFLQSPNQPIQRERIINLVWGDIRQTDNVLDTHISNLKKKLPLFRERFKLIRKRGYVYSE